MDRLERKAGLTDAVLAALVGWQSGIWTALPAYVESFDPVAMTISAKPAIKARIQSFDGNPPLPGAVLDVAPFYWVDMPVIVDVPVCFQGGGGFTFTLPISKGDECLLVFSSRCIDNWWYLGGGQAGDDAQTQGELRKHDLSDAFALVGVRSNPRTLANVSTVNAELRSDDDSVKIQLAPAKVVVNAPAVELGDGGTVRALVNDLFQAFFNNHIHTSGGSGNPTSPPTVAMDGAKLTSIVKAQ